MIENIHREDLSPTEKGKFCLSIMKKEGIKTISELSKRIKSNEDEISRWIDDYNYRKTTSDHGRKSSTTLIRATRGLENKEREKIIKYAEDKGIADWKIEKDFVPIYKKSDEPTKKALRK